MGSEMCIRDRVHISCFGDKTAPSRMVRSSYKEVIALCLQIEQMCSTSIIKLLSQTEAMEIRMHHDHLGQVVWAKDMCRQSLRIAKSKIIATGGNQRHPTRITLQGQMNKAEKEYELLKQMMKISLYRANIIFVMENRAKSPKGCHHCLHCHFKNCKNPRGPKCLQCKLMASFTIQLHFFCYYFLGF